MGYFKYLIFFDLTPFKDYLYIRNIIEQKEERK